MEIKVKKLVEDLRDINQAHNGEWYDLRAAKDVHLNEGDLAYIPLGVAIELPEGYEAIVAPRSSAAKKFGIIQANSLGVIDHAYCGDNDEWMMPVYAIRNTDIHKNDRICQFRIQKIQPEADIVYVSELGNKDRNGIGSTGTN